MDLATKVWLANEVRVWGLLATAIIGGISWAAALTHSRWQSELALVNATMAQEKERASNEKIAELRRDTAEANANIAKANQQIAEANAREKTAELDLERLRKQLQPRVLDAQAFLEPLRGIAPQRYKILYVRDTTDALQLSLQIMSALQILGWTATAYPAAIEKMDSLLPPDLWMDVGSAMSVGGQPTGISVVLRNIDDDNPVSKSLMHALANNFGKVSAGRSEKLPPDFVLFVIAPRI